VTCGACGAARRLGTDVDGVTGVGVGSGRGVSVLKGRGAAGEDPRTDPPLLPPPTRRSRVIAPTGCSCLARTAPLRYT
jgi:hypothetical protein